MWRSVDDAIIFAAAGRVAYVGAAAAAAAAFERACGAFCVRDPGDAPPDYVLECVCHGGFDGAAVVSVKRAARPQPATAAATAAALAAASRSVEAPGARDQFLLHVPRAVLALTRAPSEFVFEVSVQLAAGAFLGALYPHFEFGDSQQVAFILQLSLGGTIALSSARTFGTTRQALWRELAPNLGGMGLGATPMFAATCLVELPRLALLTLAFLSTWFPTASPRCAFARYFAPCFGAALAASGAAHVAHGAAQEGDIPNFNGSDLGRFPLVANVAQEPKSAQLSSVSFLVVAAMFSGVAPRLGELRKLGPAARPVVWGSYARWLVEALYAAEISALSTAWRMPPAFYNRPRAESALMGLLLYDYVAKSAALNCAVLVLLGVLFRLVALLALKCANRDRMGLRSPHHALLDAYAAARGGLRRCRGAKGPSGGGAAVQLSDVVARPTARRPGEASSLLGEARLNRVV
ncbi:hypothetical protein SO694_00061132 [Aureococcus anophagefferens]|uniref:Uncharacterized protein n=1 Tax=Aureococcus anophagefferens TaxID=44056 RepID=A0ABR1FR88_AURAN